MPLTENAPFGWCIVLHNPDDQHHFKASQKVQMPNGKYRVITMRFTSKEEAEQSAADYRNQGFETFVRPVGNPRQPSKSVTLVYQDGTKKQITRRTVKEETEMIIADNVFHGKKLGLSDKEINDYEQEAYNRLRQILDYIDSADFPILHQDPMTDEFVLS